MKLKISLLTMLLLIAVWLNYFVNARENVNLSHRLTSFKKMARELDVEDPDLLHVIRREPEGDNWHVHVPEGKRYQMLVVVAGYLPDKGQFPDTVTGCIDLIHGDKEIVLKRRKEIEILVDGEQRFACKNTLRGNPSETNFIDECVSFADDEKAILEKTGYKHTTSSSANGESVRKGGIQIWIEKMDPAKQYEIMPPGEASLSHSPRWKVDIKTGKMIKNF